MCNRRAAIKRATSWQLGSDLLRLLGGIEVDGNPYGRVDAVDAVARADVSVQSQ